MSPSVCLSVSLSLLSLFTKFKDVSVSPFIIYKMWLCDFLCPPSVYIIYKEMRMSPSFYLSLLSKITNSEYVSVCLFVSLYLSLSLSLHNLQIVCLYLSICFSLYFRKLQIVNMSLSLSLYLSLSLSLFIIYKLYVSIYLFVSLSTFVN